ncbi:hypothetical protein ACEQ6A_36045, partial [Rhizobium brockwellii]|uniref:hypothetical protein n=1 Tax=Rhizobium brockwellii TaxID=3019932 RepID=UPI003F9BED07
MEAVRQAAGGELLSAIDEQQATPQRIGALAGLEEKFIGRRRFLFLTPASGASKPPAVAAAAATPAAGVTTFLLAATTS